MKSYRKLADNLMKFIDSSPSVFHAVDNMKNILESSGYAELEEGSEWVITKGGRYYVVRNDSTIAAFTIPSECDYDDIKGFHIVAAHGDSPTFKIKDNPEIVSDGKYIKLNTEKYGGMIMSSWFDRPLSVAGRLAVRENGKVVSKLVNVDKDMLVIPNVAIHMNRDVNTGMDYNAQIDLLPLYSQADIENRKFFMDILAQYSGADRRDILAHDLFLYVRDKGRIIGANDEYILSPKLDDLQCAFSAITAIAEENGNETKYINMCVIFDNEEVGSSTRQGADSTFLEDTLVRIQEAFGKNSSWLKRRIHESMLISADNAHAVHPNHTEKADVTNRPYINGGVVIKYHGGQKYTTDALTAAYIKDLCIKEKIPFQTFANRSDMAGGSTLGNISISHVSVPSVDVGMPQLAMHSAVETGGVRDTEYAVKMMKAFYSCK